MQHKDSPFYPAEVAVSNCDSGDCQHGSKTFPSDVIDTCDQL